MLSLPLLPSAPRPGTSTPVQAVGWPAKGIRRMLHYVSMRTMIHRRICPPKRAPQPCVQLKTALSHSHGRRSRTVVEIRRSRTVVEMRRSRTVVEIRRSRTVVELPTCWWSNSQGQVQGTTSRFGQFVEEAIHGMGLDRFNTSQW